jgi:hypothetical protein
MNRSNGNEIVGPCDTVRDGVSANCDGDTEEKFTAILRRSKVISELKHNVL